MHIYCTYSTYILYRSVCPLLVQLHSMAGKVLNPLTPGKHTVLSWDFVSDLRNFDLHDILQENNPGVQWDLPVLQSSEIRQCVGLWISTNSVEICAISTSKTVAYPGILLGGVQQIQLRTENGDLGAVTPLPLVKGSGGSCNLVQEISFHIVKVPQFLVL